MSKRDATPNNKQTLTDTKPDAIDGVVSDKLVGAAWPAVHPGEDPVLYGHVEMTPRGEFSTRSLQTFRLVYTVGRYGIDDTGSIRIVFRFMSDVGELQTTRPADYNFVTASASTGARLSLSYGKTAHQRPWFKALTVRLHGGYLREGDTITVVYGDTSGGSPGLKLPTLADAGFEFKVLADVCSVGHYYPLKESPHISIVPDVAHSWKTVLPTLRRPGDNFRLGVKAEDLWGNPTPLAKGLLRFETSLPVNNLPQEIEYPHGEKSLVIDNLSVAEPGKLFIRTYLDDQLVATAGPLILRAANASTQSRSYWGDLHGQSGESIGITTARQYFDFARNKSFLDVTSHQANDFQVNNAFWHYLNELVAEYHETDRFVVFPGYEWSGNTAVGGDRNVFFSKEGRQIHRSSHALLPERDDIDTDAPTAAELFDALQDEDCVVYAHVGGRYADMHQAHDPRLETAMEIHSAWGTFEWLLTDGFALGHRCGVVCNSDGHKGRPGASYPGTAQFGAYGGLTCFLTDDLSRQGIFDCLRQRRHYATTGCRLHMDVDITFNAAAERFDKDPSAWDDATATTVESVMMGDIVRSDASTAHMALSVEAMSPLERIEVRNGTTVIETLKPYADKELGSRIRVIWRGAEYRGRGRQTTWTGAARFTQATIRRLSKINAWNHERKLQQNGSQAIEFDAITTGNFGGFDVWLDESQDATMELITNQGTLTVDLATLGNQDVVLDAGGLGKQLQVFRLPENNPHRSMETTVDIPLHSKSDNKGDSKSDNKSDNKSENKGDNPLWICVTTEDGFQAWSSPAFVFS